MVKWFSDRRIKREGFRSKYSANELPKTVIPDGIVITKKGERVAFEFEMSQRQRRRFIDKAKSLVGVMYSENPLLHKVIWIGSSEKIVSELKNAVDEGVFYNDSKKLFKVSEYEYFLETVRSQDRREGAKNV